MDAYQGPSQPRCKIRHQIDYPSPNEFNTGIKKRPPGYGGDESPSKRLRSSPDESASEQTTPHVWKPIPVTRLSPLHDNYSNGGAIEGASSPSLHQPSRSDQRVSMEGVEYIVATSENSEKNICYGALCDSKLCFVGTKAVSIPLDHNKFRQCEIIPSGQDFALCDSNRSIFAVLDLITCQVLRDLNRIPGIEVMAYIEVKNLLQAKTKKFRTKGTSPLSINIYGPLASADQVGTTLSKGSTFLQIPYFLEPGWNYFNPQLFRHGGEMQNLTHLVGLTDNEFQAIAISDAIEHVLDSLSLPEQSYEQSQDMCTEGLQPDVIMTQLKSHQLGALAFILRREDHDFCQRAQRDLRRLTGIRDDIASYGTGGILADTMGLGKTLTTISSIAATIEHARQYTTTQLDIMTDEALQQSRGTLVVVSSMQVLDVWETEIINHVKPAALTTYVFHGNGRPRSPEYIIDHDIILTTYATLVADDKTDKVLRSVQWYRVVLDEAHWIRNQGSKQFKAAKGLVSARRWCLTGTPIQNRMNDLISLLDFLHFEPFARKSIFEKHILEPLSRDTPDRAFRLQMLLRTICLRRTEKLLNLPEPRFDQVMVTMCPEEMSLYHGIIRKCARDIDEAVSSPTKKIKKYNILFTATMALRRLCNHGTFPIQTVRSGSSALTPETDFIFECDFCHGDNEGILELVSMGEVCVQCGRTLYPATRPCNASAALDSEYAAVDTLNVSPAVNSGVNSPQSTPQPFSSTKLQTVVDTIEGLQPGSKSLVFSYWTATLDLLEHHLQSKKIHYLRIDGRVNFNQRLDILRTFRESAVPVLLMSIQTGALGLNLTVANYVHIVEPQWNPSVEEQAIARAVRMGQTRRVTIFRYIVKESVEENIISLQKRKRNLAKFTLEGGPGDRSSDSLDDLKFVLDFGSI